MKTKKNHRQFYLPYYAGDDHSDSWFSYLHRNLHHLSGEDFPFPGSEWHNDESDAKIHDDIIDALYHSQNVDASRIKIIVLNRNVGLSGNVSSMKEKKEAERLVRSIPEVWDVTNDIVITFGQ